MLAIHLFRIGKGQTGLAIGGGTAVACGNVRTRIYEGIVDLVESNFVEYAHVVNM